MANTGTLSTLHNKGVLNSYMTFSLILHVVSEPSYMNLGPNCMIIIFEPNFFS